MSGERRPSRQDALSFAVRVLTACAQTFFWAVCYHYFGTKAVIHVVAAWAFVSAAKDLSFARARLANMANPEKRRSALAKSVSIEALLLVLRVALIFGIGHAVARLDSSVSRIALGLIPVAIFWPRETLITLTRVYRVNGLNRYVTLLAAISGLSALILLAEWNFTPERAATGALLIREATSFFGYAIVVALGRFSGRFQAAMRPGDDDDADDEGGGAVVVLDEQGREIRSTFKTFIADNVVHSHWRVVKFGTRVVAHGIFGPFGTVLSRLFFSYRQPGPYVHKERRVSARTVAGVVLALVMIGVGLVVAQRFGLLKAVKVAGAGFGLRAIGLGVNTLLWRRLRSLVGTGLKVRVPKMPFRSKDPPA